MAAIHDQVQKAARAPLLRLGKTLIQTEVDAGRRVLMELMQMQPGRPEAGEALKNWSTRLSSD